MDVISIPVTGQNSSPWQPPSPPVRPVVPRHQTTDDLVSLAATVGVVAAGLSLLEVALLPGLAVGAAALAARNLVAKRPPDLLSRLRLPVSLPWQSPNASATPHPKFAVKQALAKTITFRIIVTALDFTWNYAIIGEVAAAASLSAISLAVGPVFYFLHETSWNYFSSPETTPKRPRISVGKTTVSRALVKTIVFRTMATTAEFTTNYLVVGDLSMAAKLSAFGFVAGPFIYWGHEMAWDYYSPPSSLPVEPTLLKLSMKH